MAEREQAALIPGLPDDIALDCLARVPHRFHPSIRPVCRRWRDLVTAPSFRRHRERIGAAEDLVFMIQALLPIDGTNQDDAGGGGAHDDAAGDDAKERNKNGAANCTPPVYALGLYNATAGSWHRVAAAAVPMFAQCAAVGDNKLVLVGGWDPETLDPVPDVRILDLATGAWRRGAPMAAARSFFACAAADGRVYVAGGHDGQKNALRSAEAYDVTADRWAALPAMAEERDECQGAVARGGGFWAVSGYKTESQGVFDTAAECYDPISGDWTKEEGFLAEGGGGGGGEAAGVAAAPSAAAFFAVGEERLFCVDCGGGRREVREYEGREKGWGAAGALPEGLASSPCAAAAMRGGGGGERVFVIGADGGGGGYGAWVMEVASRKWTKVYTPPGFSGFVYSAAALRL